METAVRDSALLSLGNLTRRAWEAHTPCGSSTEEQRSQTAFCVKTLRAAGLLALAGVGSVVTARCGDAPPSPPWPKPKYLAAAPLAILRQALKQSDSRNATTRALTGEPPNTARRAFPADGVNGHDEITEFQDSLLNGFHDPHVLCVEVIIV